MQSTIVFHHVCHDDDDDDDDDDDEYTADQRPTDMQKPVWGFPLV